MMKVTNLREFIGFNILEWCNVDLLQFADDTLIIGERTWKNIWTIKDILRVFELFLGLGVNFHKKKSHRH